MDDHHQHLDVEKSKDSTLSSDEDDNTLDNDQPLNASQRKKFLQRNLHNDDPNHLNDGGIRNGDP